jgi:hypothetical protein
MSTEKDRLERNGWVRISYRKMGCMRIARWEDPKNGDVMSQGAAIETLIRRKWADKIQAARVK